MTARQQENGNIIWILIESKISFEFGAQIYNHFH